MRMETAVLPKRPQLRTSSNSSIRSSSSVCDTLRSPSKLIFQYRPYKGVSVLALFISCAINSGQEEHGRNPARSMEHCVPELLF